MMMKHIESEVFLEAQIRVFRELRETGKLADYVTITIGGNDVKFSEIITEAVVKSTTLTEIVFKDPVWNNISALKDVERILGSRLGVNIKEVWKLYWKESGIRDSLKQPYWRIAREAGPQATILVAGYPHLLEPNGKGLPISREEAKEINAAVDNFNAEIAALVKECSEEGLNIRFVDVQQNYFRDHGAFANLPYINDLKLNIETEDLGEDVPSAYSFHPNAEGAKAYARAVNHAILVCESEKYLRAMPTPEEDAYVSYDFGLFTGIIQMPEKLADDEYNVPPARSDCTIILYDAQGNEAYVYEQNGRAGICLCVKSGEYHYEILSPTGEILLKGECEIGRNEQFWQAFQLPGAADSPFAEDGWYQVLVNDVTLDDESDCWVVSGDVLLPRPLLLTSEQARAIIPDSNLGDVYIRDVQGSVDDGDLTMNDGSIWLEPNGNQWEVLGEGAVSLMYDERYASFKVRRDATIHWERWDDEEMDIADDYYDSPLDLLDDYEMYTMVNALIEDGEAVELYRTDDEAW